MLVLINFNVRVKNLIKKAGTRDLEELADFLNIHIRRIPYKSPKTKGFFKKMLNNKFIVINSNLDENFQKVVLAHEIGHAVLHASKSDMYWHEYSYCPRGKFEIDANRFAAELLIDDNDIDSVILDGMSINQLATYYKVPTYMVEHKLAKKKIVKVKDLQ